MPRFPSAIFEINRIDLVWHRRGADLARLRALAEVADRDIPPDIARRIDEDSVDACQRVEILGHPVMRLDLSGERVGLEPE